MSIMVLKKLKHCHIDYNSQFCFYFYNLLFWFQFSLKMEQNQLSNDHNKEELNNKDEIELKDKKSKK